MKRLTQLKRGPIFLILVFLSFILPSCSDDESSSIENETDLRIISIEFKASENEGLEEDITNDQIIVDHEELKIFLNLPFNHEVEDIDQLKPTVTISPNAELEIIFGRTYRLTDKNDSFNTVSYTLVTDLLPNDKSKITNFFFNSFVAGNEDLLRSVYGDFESSSNGVTPVKIEVPYNTDITSLTPSMDLPDFADVKPAIGITDFSSPITYTITSQDGKSTSVYEVTVTFALNHEAKINSFKFLASENSSLDNDVTATIYDEEPNAFSKTKKIILEIPFGTNISNLNPSIETSFGATLNLEGEQNFSNTITYKVTAENGEVISDDYNVIVANPDRKALIDLYFANRENATRTVSINANFDIYDPDLSKYSWIGTDENTGRVTSLNFSFIYMKSIPKSIGNLQELGSLYITNQAGIGSHLNEIPEELGLLTKLKILYIEDMGLESIPDAIWNFKNLNWLNLKGNHLKSIPSKIGELTELTFLYLNENELTSLPDEFSNLTDLSLLDLSDNQLTSVPHTLGDMDLVQLDLRNNQLTTIPQGICDRKELFTDNILFDEGVTCK